MSGLSAFFSQNAERNDTVEYVASNRFQEKGKPIKWKLKGLTGKEDEEIRKECTKRVPIPGKRGQYTRETDYNRYLGKLAAACTVFPNLSDAELQNSYGAMGADELLKIMLKPGEYADFLNKVQEVNGFDISTEELVEEAKN